MGKCGFSLPSFYKYRFLKKTDKKWYYLFIYLIKIKGFNGFVSSRIPTKGTTLVPTIGTTKNWEFYKVLKISML